MSDYVMFDLYGKYEFTGEVKQILGVNVQRIRARRNFGDVCAGDLGGWVESERNLNWSDGSWVADEAVAMGNAVVMRNAIVRGSAIVRGNMCVLGRSAIGGHVTLDGRGLVEFDREQGEICGNIDFKFDEDLFATIKFKKSRNSSNWLLDVSLRRSIEFAASDDRSPLENVGLDISCTYDRVSMHVGDPDNGLFKQIETRKHAIAVIREGYAKGRKKEASRLSKDAKLATVYAFISSDDRRRRAVHVNIGDKWVYKPFRNVEELESLVSQYWGRVEMSETPTTIEIHKNVRFGCMLDMVFGNRRFN